MDSQLDLGPDQMLNLTPEQSFINTRKALSVLQASLRCQNCSCVEPKAGEACPICTLPSFSYAAKVDLQLSNIASLCHQMVQLFDGKSTNARQSDFDTPNPKDNSKTREKTFGNNCHQNESLEKTTQKRKSQRKKLKSGDAEVEEKKTEVESKDNIPLSQLSNNSVNNTENRKRKFLPASASKKDGKRKHATKSETDASNEEDYSICGLKKRIVKNQSRNSKSPRDLTPDVKRGTGSARKAKQPNTNKRNAKGETTLQVATIKANIKDVKKLLEAGANPNVKDNAGWTPLHEAVIHGNIDIAALLLANGASVNAPGLENDTPLHDAVSNYQLDCIRLLMSKGANTYLRNSQGKSPMDMARTEEIKQLLQSASSVTGVMDNDDQTLFEESAKTICILSSMLGTDDQAVLHEFLQMFDCKMQENSTQGATHLITGIDAESVPQRTKKYLSSILSGLWIVSSDWLKACVNGGKIVPEKAFLVSGCSNHPSAPLRAAENRLKQLPRLFDGCQFYLYSKFTAFSNLPREQIIELIKLGGGVILSREPRLHNLDDYPYTRPYHAQDSNSLADCTIYKIYEDTCPNPPHVKSQRMSCLPLSWLIDSISSFSLLEKTGYIHS